MTRRTVASTYAQTAIESAPPLKIIHLMYEGALRLLEQAAAIDPAAEPSAFAQRLNRAQDIVSELRISLDPKPAPELAENLTALYLFVEEQIHQAINDSDAAPLQPARNVLATLLSGWKELEVEGLERSA